MNSFAHDLSVRLASHDSFWSFLGKLQGSGIAKTLSKPLSGAPSIEHLELKKLHYCASVFAQTEDESFKSIAQTIALNTLLLAHDEAMRESSMHLLNELGNFPGLKYVDKVYGCGNASFLERLNRKVSQALNTVPIGDVNLPLTDYQKRVWDDLPGGKSLAITAPTSAGKSFLVVEHLCRLAESRPSFGAIYIAPTRALLSEVHQKIQARLSAREHIRVSTVPSLDPQNRDHQVFILTQERLQVLLATWGGVIDLVVVDEAQNLSDAARGMILQDCLEAVVARNHRAQVVMLAPGAVGLPDIAKTIGIETLVSQSTTVSPVLQNRIVVTKVPGHQNQLSLSLLKTPSDRVVLGTVETANGLDNPDTRLAAVALELGGVGGSLVYETGPNEAEKTALQLMNGLMLSGESTTDTSLAELSKFIKDHIHPEYGLAQMVRQGVAYHYGRMPSLLREAIESSFKRDGEGLRYLVCTTTLAQGINLPARNVFIDSPMRGRKEQLDPALLWNFAGRAGRMNQDIVGNVFLVNYEDWGARPMDEFVPFEVKSAVTSTLTNQKELDMVVRAVQGHMPRALPWDEEATRVRACAGLLIAKASRGEVTNFITTVVPEATVDNIYGQLASHANDAVKKVGLPEEVIAANWTIDPYGLRRLFDNIIEKIEVGEIAKLIPVNPHDAPSGHYAKLFNRIIQKVFERTDNFGALVGSLAVDWMKGTPYPVLIGKWIKRERNKEAKELEVALSQAKEGGKPKKAKKPKPVDALIREAFQLIEDVVRFQLVQLGKAYRDLLILALKTTGQESRIGEVYDFALALELGVSTDTGTAFVELGLSRISASTLTTLFPSSNMSVQQARVALKTLDVETNKLSSIIVTELQRLGLLVPAEPVDWHPATH